MSFNDKYKNIKKLVQSELDIIEEKMVSQIEMREPLNTYVKDFLKLPSKRIRSVATLLYLKANGIKITDVHYNLLSAVELIHNSSLIHDDVIDESDLRRSHKTLSAEFDNKLAIISGDYLLSLALGFLTKVGSIPVFELFSRTFKNMCIGEINQNFDKFKIGTLDEYIEKTENKTAYLFYAAIVSATLITKENFECADKFAMDLGIAFQIRDDLLNVLACDFSKPENNDIADGIYNAPVIFSGSVENYQAGIEKTRDLLNNYIKSAENNLKHLPENDYKTALLEVLELLNNE